MPYRVPKVPNVSAFLVYFNTGDADTLDIFHFLYFFKLWISFPFCISYKVTILQFLLNLQVVYLPFYEFSTIKRRHSKDDGMLGKIVFKPKMLYADKCREILKSKEKC